MRAAGASTWHGLATAREGSQLIAHVDDERFRNGAYEFRAHAVDHAGNEASTGRRADGSAATLRLPARIETRLAVGMPRTTVRRRVVRRHGRRTVVRRRIRRLDSHVLARHGRKVRLAGVLANSDGQPIEGATIEAIETQPDGATAAVGLATTDAAGKFKYVVKATRNRSWSSDTAVRGESDPRPATSFCSCPPARRSVRTGGGFAMDSRCSSPAECARGRCPASGSSWRCRPTSAAAGERSRRFVPAMEAVGASRIASEARSAGSRTDSAPGYLRRAATPSSVETHASSRWW